MDQDKPLNKEAEELVSLVVVALLKAAPRPLLCDALIHMASLMIKVLEEHEQGKHDVLVAMTETTNKHWAVLIAHIVLSVIRGEEDTATEKQAEAQKEASALMTKIIRGSKPH